MSHASTAKSRRLLPPRSSRQVAIDEVIERAEAVIGDREEALRWIGTPVAAFGYATPISLLSTPEGKQRVLAILEQLEYGVL